MAQIRVQLLGGFGAITPDGAPLNLPTRKAEALLAVLACRPGEAQSRERVTSLLWGDRGDRQARHSLSQTLTSIRSAVGQASNPIITERESMAINPDAVCADVMEIVTLVQRDDADSLRRAAELYRGALLEGFRLHDPAFNEWLSQERSRFHQIALSALTRLAEREAAAGDHLAATSVLERAAALEPLSEDVHRRLMRLQLDRGNYNAVIRHYRNCSDLLKRELGTIPEPATTALYTEARSRLKQVPQPTDE